MNLGFIVDIFIYLITFTNVDMLKFRLNCIILKLM